MYVHRFINLRIILALDDLPLHHTHWYFDRSKADQLRTLLLCCSIPGTLKLEIQDQKSLGHRKICNTVNLMDLERYEHLFTRGCLHTSHFPTSISLSYSLLMSRRDRKRTIWDRCFLTSCSGVVMILVGHKTDHRPLPSPIESYTMIPTQRVSTTRTTFLSDS